MFSKLSQEIHHVLRRVVHTWHTHHPAEKGYRSNSLDDASKLTGGTHSKHDHYLNHHQKIQAESEGHEHHQHNSNDVLTHHPETPSTLHSSPSHH